jgi:hypothetical protein
LLVAEICGYDPIVIFDIDWGDYDPALKWEEQLLEEGPNRFVKGKKLHTPRGDWRIVYSEPFHSTPEQVAFPLHEPEEYEVLHWYVARINECVPRITGEIQRMRESVGDRGLIALRIGYPHELLSYTIPYLLSLISLPDRIYHWVDYPELYREAMEDIHGMQKCIVDVGSAAGCDLFFFGTFGTEIFSPALFAQAIGPYARDMCQYIRAHGAFSYYHACGHNRKWLELGYLNDVHPTLLEGFTPPPAGTVDDLKWARQVTDPDICTRGNLDVDLVRDGTPEAIERATLQILDATQGWRQIVGTG